MSRWTNALVTLTVVALAVALAVWIRPATPAAVAQDGGQAFLPLTWKAISARDLPTAPVIEPKWTEPPAATATETLQPPPPTFTPLPTWTPEPTEPPVPSLIHGRMTLEGDPLDPGFGSVGGPQIELRLCESVDGEPCRHADWSVVATTMSEEDGHFAFRSPPPLDEGQLYQVWWTNEDSDTRQGDARFVRRWWSRVVDAFGPGDEVDLGVFDLTDLKLKAPPHDISHSLPVVFEWNRRGNRGETYRWSLFRGCGDPDNREGAYRTPPLGYVDEHQVDSPPPGFRLNEKYCWYVFIEDGDNGTGWPFFDWRITFLPTP